MELALAHLSRAKALAAGTTHVQLAVPDRIRLARTNFGAFCSIFGKPPADHHKIWHDEIVTDVNTSQLLRIGGPNTAILAPRGPLDLDTLVATPGGWRRLGDIRPGDEVISEGGLPIEVLATISHGKARCFRVTFSDGISMVCDDSHRFAVRRMGTDKKGEWRVVTLQEIRRFVTVGSEGNWRTGVKRVIRMAEEGEKPWLDQRGYARYQVPVADAVEYEEADLPLDPYVLGVLIGDGALTTGGVRFHKDVPDLVDRVRESLPPDHELVQVGGRAGSWAIRHVDGVKRIRGYQALCNDVTHVLKGMGLWGCKSHEKFIPRIYLMGSIAQRLALLQGLLDTDGTCKKQAGRGGVSFGTSSEQLLADICELARSLGGMAFLVKPYQSGYRKADGTWVPCRMAYRVSFRFPPGVLPFHASPKADLYLGPSTGKTNGGMARSIVEIEPVGEREIGCITVDSPREMFLIKDYIVSMNSAKSTTLGMLPAWLIGVHGMERMMLRMLYLGYSLDIARSRSHTIKTIITSQKYREIFPMIAISKARQSDELWSIDFETADIEPDADDPYTLVGQGLSGSITSRRSQLIILDDVIKSSEAIQNPAIRKKLITNWNEVVQPTLLEGGRAIALGTRFSAADIFATTFSEKNGWRVVTQQAIITDAHGIEQSYWPQMYSLEHLRKLRREDPISFSYQFQNKPVSQSEIDFPADWLKLGDISNSYDAVGIGIDLSSALKERSDWTVFLLLGRVDDRIECIDYRRLRAMGNIEKIEALCDLMLDWGIVEMEEEDGGRTKKWYPTDVGVTAMVEAIAYQQSLQADAESIVQADRGLHNIQFKPVKSWRGDKLTRLRGTFGLFQSGRITWNRFINWEPFWSELLNYGNADHDDCPDALVIGLKGVVGAGQLQTAWDEWEGID